MKDKVVIAEKEAAAAEEPNPKGIPEFWFTIFRNVDMLSELVQVGLPTRERAVGFGGCGRIVAGKAPAETVARKGSRGPTGRLGHGRSPGGPPAAVLVGRPAAAPQPGSELLCLLYVLPHASRQRPDPLCPTVT